MIVRRDADTCLARSLARSLFVKDRDRRPRYKSLSLERSFKPPTQKDRYRSHGAPGAVRYDVALVPRSRTPTNTHDDLDRGRSIDPTRCVAAVRPRSARRQPRRNGRSIKYSNIPSSVGASRTRCASALRGSTTASSRRSSSSASCPSTTRTRASKRPTRSCRATLLPTATTNS